jgi:plastocyanin
MGVRGGCAIWTVVLMSGAVQAKAAASAASPIATIVVDKLAFGPASAPLRVGQHVRWVNRDLFQHSATATDHSSDVVLPVGGQGEIVLKRAGVISYFCRYHPGMKGRLTVKK